MSKVSHECCPRCGHELTYAEIAELANPSGFRRHIAVERDGQRVVIDLADWDRKESVLQG